MVGWGPIWGYHHRQSLALWPLVTPLKLQITDYWQTSTKAASPSPAPLGLSRALTTTTVLEQHPRSHCKGSTCMLTQM